MNEQPRPAPDAVSAQEGSGPTAAIARRLWDIPTRLVHWALVLALAFSWYTAEIERMELHRTSGYVVLGLVVFRLYWGIVGASSARFSNFISGPKAVMRYARTLPSRTGVAAPGHNPLGGWSVAAMLLLMLAQVIFGLFAMDIDGLESGPLSRFVDFETARLFAAMHEYGFLALQILVAIHVAAVIFYLVYKRQNLIAAMITGARAFPTDPGVRFAPLWRAALGAAVAAGLAWIVGTKL